MSFEATVTGRDEAYGLATLQVRGGAFLVPASPEHTPGTRLRLRVAAGDVSLTRSPPGDTTILNILPARIAGISPSGEHEVIVVLALGGDGRGERMLARVTRLSRSRLELAEGMLVYAQVKGVALARRSMTAREPTRRKPSTLLWRVPWIVVMQHFVAAPDRGRRSATCRRSKPCRRSV